MLQAGELNTGSLINEFYSEIIMNTPAEFRKHAADCEKMARVSKDPETKAVWKRMAERWLLCAKLAEDQDSFQRRLTEEKFGGPHPYWAAAAGAHFRPPAPTRRTLTG
jgi:hypothetical protein